MIKPIRHSFLYSLSGVGIALLQLVFSTLSLRYFDEELFANYLYVFSFFGIARGWLGVRLVDLLAIEVSENTNIIIADYFGTELFFRLCSIIVVLPFVVFRVPNSVLFVAIIDFWLTGLLMLNQSVGNGSGDTKKAYKPYLVWLILRLIGTILLIEFVVLDFQHIFLISSALTILLFYRHYIFMVNYRKTMRYISRNLKLFANIYLDGGINGALKNGDIWIVSTLGGTHIILAYKALKSFRGLVDSVFSKIYTSMLPLNNSKVLSIYKSTILFTSLLLYFVAIIFSIDKVVLELLFPRQAESIASVIRLVLLFEVIRGNLSLFSVDLVRNQRYFWKSIAAIFSAAILISFYWIIDFNLLYLFPAISLLSIICFLILGNLINEQKSSLR